VALASKQEQESLENQVSEEGKEDEVDVMEEEEEEGDNKKEEAKQEEEPTIEETAPTEEVSELDKDLDDIGL